MVTAVFTDNDDYARTYGLWQWDYGQQLRIEGLHLPTAVEIHFALQETGGEAITRVGTTKDGVTTVTIPDSMLEGNRAAWTAEKAYNIYAWIYLSDQKSGETIKRITMQVKSRPKPEAFEAPGDGEIFREAIEAVNDAAKRAEEAGGKAVAAADEAEKAATQTAEHLEAVQGLAEQVETNADTVAQDKQTVTGMLSQAQQAASDAALSAQAAKLSETAAAQAQTGAEAAEDGARQYAEDTGADRQAVANDKQAVTQIREAVAADRKVVEQTATQFGQIAQDTLTAIGQAQSTAVGAVEAEGQKQTTAVQEAGTQAVSEVTEAKTEAVQSVTAEGDKQTKRVEDAAAGIVADREQITANKADIDALKQAVSLERAVENYYAMRRTGKVYQTKIWKFDVNPTSAGEKLLDNAGLAWEPSTDTVKGADDYADIPLFGWKNVNYVRDPDGTPRPVALEGGSDYKTSGPVDVGTMQMSFWWDWDSSNPEYDLITISDMPHPELGLTPWPECVKADGTVVPWCIGSKYFSGVASDGLLRSQPGLPLANFQSHNNMIVNYQKKGEGYLGAGAARNLFQIVFNIIKGATKNSQSLYSGCTSYNWQYDASIERSTKETYFPVTNAQADNILVGSRVYVGYGSDNKGALNKDRGVETMRAYADMAKVIRIEPLDDANKAVYLDISDGFSTTLVEVTETLQSPIIISSMPWGAGNTDAVIGHHDGSAVSNSDGKHPYRVQGREYAVGCYAIASDTVLDFQPDHSKNVYVAERGLDHSSADTVIKSTYRMIGNIPALPDGKDFWIGDISVDKKTGAWFVAKKGSGSTQGYGDMLYSGGTSTSGTREFMQGGSLWLGSSAGCACLDCGNWLGRAGWDCGGCD
jgi:hypothetical protein